MRGSSGPGSIDHCGTECKSRGHLDKRSTPLNLPNHAACRIIWRKLARNGIQPERSLACTEFPFCQHA
jgi:hypothetical protein